MIEIKREDLPVQANNTLDWEYVFSDPKDGLVTLLSNAPSLDALDKIFQLILQFLFARDGDSTFRETHIEDFQRYSENVDHDFDKSLTYAKEILIKIKNDRIEIARNYIPKTESDHRDEKAIKPVSENISMQDSLIEIIINDYRETLKPVTLETYDQSLGKLPFIFSKDFHDIFFAEIQDFCLHEIAADCDVLISKKPRLQKQFEDVRQAGTLKNMAFRDKVWDSWRQMWEINTKKQAILPKPKAPKGVRALGEIFSNEYEKELESWKRKTRLKKAHNKKLSEFYKVICAENDAYAAPSREEVLLLVKTFGKTEEVFERHITALKQFFEQDTEHLARTFARFIDGRNIDLSLLYILFEQPELITGEENFLKFLMRSYTESTIKNKLPYTYRYLKDYMF